MSCQRALRRAPFSIVLVAASLLLGGQVYAANARSFNINAWSGGPAFDERWKHFDHCSATSSNDRGISIAYVVNSQYEWQFVFSSANWDFTSGGSFYLNLRLNDRSLPGQRGLVRGNQTLLFAPSDGINVADALRIGGNLGVAVGGTFFTFELRDTNDVMNALVQCVAQEVGLPPHSKPNQMLRSGPSSRLQQRASSSPANIAEATALASNIIASAEIKDAQLLPPKENTADPNVGAAWKAGPLTVTISVLPSEFTKINDVAMSSINDELRICPNQLFAATAAEIIDQSPVRRLLTVCHSPEAAASKYRLVVPRPKGGYYVVTVLVQGVEFVASPDRPATNMDRKIRAVITNALSKMDQTIESQQQ
jgi:hypothetical protein